MNVMKMLVWRALVCAGLVGLLAINALAAGYSWSVPAPGTSTDLTDGNNWQDFATGATGVAPTPADFISIGGDTRMSDGMGGQIFGGPANNAFPVIDGPTSVTTATLYLGNGNMDTPGVNDYDSLTINPGGQVVATNISFFNQGSNGTGPSNTWDGTFIGTTDVNINGGDLLLMGGVQMKKYGTTNINVTNGGTLRTGTYPFPNVFVPGGDFFPIHRGPNSAASNPFGAAMGTLTIDNSTVILNRLRGDWNVNATATGSAENAAANQYYINIVGSGMLEINLDAQAQASLAPGSGNPESLWESAYVSGYIRGNGIGGNVLFTPVFDTSNVVTALRITAVPEPSSITLGLSTVLGMVLVGRRKRA